MKNQAKICVIVPVYNVKQYIHRCVDSILTQSFQDFFIILVDDGSPDNCGEICDDYEKKDDRIKVLHKKNGGQGEARNLALDWAYANLVFEWIAFVDSDDWIHVQYLELLLEAAVNNNIGISSCGYISTGESVDDIQISRPLSVVCDSADNLISVFDHDEFNLGVPWGRLFHKDFFIDLRYPIDRYYEDGFTIYKALFSVDQIAVIQEKLYYWYRNPTSTIRSNITEKKINDYIDAMLEPIAFYKDKGFENAYQHEVSIFLYRLKVHLESYEVDTKLSRATERFIREARKLIRSDRKNFPFSKYDDGYKMIFSPMEYNIYRLLNKFGL